MIDIEKVQKCISRKTELSAEAVVLKELNNFMFESTVKCKDERSWYKLQAWLDISKEVQDIISKRLANITVEIEDIRKQLAEEESQ